MSSSTEGSESSSNSSSESGSGGGGGGGGGVSGGGGGAAITHNLQTRQRQNFALETECSNFTFIPTSNSGLNTALRTMEI